MNKDAIREIFEARCRYIANIEKGTNVLLIIAILDFLACSGLIVYLLYSW